MLSFGIDYNSRIPTFKDYPMDVLGQFAIDEDVIVDVYLDDNEAVNLEVIVKTFDESIDDDDVEDFDVDRIEFITSDFHMYIPEGTSLSELTDMTDTLFRAEKNNMLDVLYAYCDLNDEIIPSWQTLHDAQNSHVATVDDLEEFARERTEVSEHLENHIDWYSLASEMLDGFSEYRYKGKIYIFS